MRKVIAFIVMGALASALLSSPAQALQYDPKNPRPHQVVSRSVSADDSGWDDPQTGPPCVVFHPGSLFTLLYSSNFGLAIHGFIIDFTTDFNNRHNEDNLHNRDRSGTDTK
jgi:hypothetical protein